MRTGLMFVPRVNFNNYQPPFAPEDLITSEDIYFPSETDGETIYKNFRNFFINEGHTVSVTNRCKGLVIYVADNCIINGVLSMSKRGCRWTPDNDFIPNNIDNLITPNGVQDFRIGKWGGNSTEWRWWSHHGYDGNAGVNGACGGGGSGGSRHWNCTVYAGYGGQGTALSGGAGGGGVSRASSSGHSGPGSNVGGAGGWASAYENSGWRATAGGGAGNPGGSWSSHRGGWAEDGEDGTGGTLVLIVKRNLVIGSNGVIQADGARGGDTPCHDWSQTWGSGGGGSGGGSITVLYSGNFINNGTIRANGGYGGNGEYYGGNGGVGSMRIHRIYR